MLGIDIQQILLHLMNFVILAGGLYILLYKPVKDFMDKREHVYKSMDEAAQENVENAKSLKESYEKQLENIKNEAAEIKNQASADAKAAADKTIADANKEAEKIIKTARENASREKERIISSAREEVAELASMAAAKILDGEDMYSDFVAAAKKSDSLNS